MIVLIDPQMVSNLAELIISNPGGADALMSRRSWLDARDRRRGRRYADSGRGCRLVPEAVADAACAQRTGFKIGRTKDAVNAAVHVLDHGNWRPKWPVRGLSANQIAGALISMMVRSKTLQSETGYSDARPHQLGC